MSYQSIQIPGNYNKLSEERTRKIQRMGLSVQPYIVVIGAEENQKFYVRVNAITYELPSLLKAIDVLFKLSLAYDIAYPPECSNICYALQWGLLNIHTALDKKISFVFNTLNRIKNQTTKT